MHHKYYNESEVNQEDCVQILHSIKSGLKEEQPMNKILIKSQHFHELLK